MSLPSRERGLKSAPDPAQVLALGSLPSRERGLKSDWCASPIHPAGSLPSRERGLKCECRAGERHGDLSLPSRERGLKFGEYGFSSHFLSVAPFTGAWIEILCPCSSGPCRRVAPFTGAWIEIMAVPVMAWIGRRRSLHGSVD